MSYTKSGFQVFNEVKEVISSINSKFPNAKIILCEVTPKKDERDQHVIECNRLINEFSREENIFIANHSNLRDNKYAMLIDNKHVSEYKMSTFAVNMKKALCAAYGKQYLGRQRNNSLNNSSNNQRIEIRNSNGYSNRKHVQTRLMALANGSSTTQVPYMRSGKSGIDLKSKLYEVFKHAMESVLHN